MLELAHPKPGEIGVDLGSGDGRILIAFAKRGVHMHGFEMDPTLIEKSQKYIQREGLEDRIILHNSNFWDADLSQYEVVTVYGMPDVMDDLEAKLLHDLKPGAKVLLNYYTFNHLEPTASKDNVYLYVIR